MTTDSFERRLSTWLEQDAQDRVPDHLVEILVATRATRQRPAWSSLERWLPMTTTIQQRVAPRPIAPWLYVALAALLLALLATALMIGARKPLPVLGPAANGLVAYVDGDEVRMVSPDGQHRTLVMDFGGQAPTALAWSVDGTRLAIRTSGPAGQVVSVDAAGGNRRILSGDLLLEAGDGVAWSPDSTRVAFVARVAGQRGLYVATADGSRIDRLPDAPGVIELTTPAWAPDGSLIAYVRFEPTGPVLQVVRPDGSGVRTLATSAVNADVNFGRLAFAPDTAHQRLVYVSGNNVEEPAVVKIFDLTTGIDATAGEGFWPSWSSDGSRVSWLDGALSAIGAADVDAVLVGNPTGVALQPAAPGNTCQENPDLAGRAICSTAVWSPDGRRIAGPDMVGEAIVLLSVDGSGAPIVIPLGTPTDLPGVMPAWQPVAP